MSFGCTGRPWESADTCPPTKIVWPTLSPLLKRHGNRPVPLARGPTRLPRGPETARAENGHRVLPKEEAIGVWSRDGDSRGYRPRLLEGRRADLRRLFPVGQRAVADVECVQLYDVVHLSPKPDEDLSDVGERELGLLDDVLRIRTGPQVIQRHVAAQENEITAPEAMAELGTSRPGPVRLGLRRDTGEPGVAWTSHRNGFDLDRHPRVREPRQRDCGDCRGGFDANTAPHSSQEFHLVDIVRVPVIHA